mmetsp:Transcript_5567/g.21021  ORF Transcript_5567/g.21021 Transcript_5567/m.21021 type:complete len:88 (-) Transcript_5567:88-351(-)
MVRRKMTSRRQSLDACSGSGRVGSIGMTSLRREGESWLHEISPGWGDCACRVKRSCSATQLRSIEIKPCGQLCYVKQNLLQVHYRAA